MFERQKARKETAEGWGGEVGDLRKERKSVSSSKVDRTARDHLMTADEAESVLQLRTAQ